MFSRIDSSLFKGEITKYLNHEIQPIVNWTILLVDENPNSSTKSGLENNSIIVIAVLSSVAVIVLLLHYR